MKKIIFCVMTFSIAFELNGQEQQQVEIKDGTPFSYVYMEFSGSHYQIPQKIPLFIQEARKQQLQTKVTGDLFGIYFDFRGQVSGVDTVWGFGFKMVKDTTVQLPLKKAQYNYEKIARMIHVGPYVLVGLAYSVMIPLIEEKGMEVIGPPIETWLDDPDQVKPEDCRTEVIIPVRKIKK
jgi:DNA gyrase inhibitor GyrI